VTILWGKGRAASSSYQRARRCRGIWPGELDRGKRNIWVEFSRAGRGTVICVMPVRRTGRDSVNRGPGRDTGNFRYPKVSRLPAHAVWEECAAHWGVCPLLIDLLLRTGWCINGVHRLADTQSVPSMLYAASVQKRETIPPEMHAGCSGRGCIARTIDESTYVTQNVSPGCRCGHVESLLEEVKEILDKGGIPVVVVKVDPEYVRCSSRSGRNRPSAVWPSLMCGQIDWEIRPGTRYRHVSLGEYDAVVPAYTVPSILTVRLLEICSLACPPRIRLGPGWTRCACKPIACSEESLLSPS